eukprot:9480242-Pyramimonas_sp.AAC.1
MVATVPFLSSSPYIAAPTSPCEPSAGTHDQSPLSNLSGAGSFLCAPLAGTVSTPSVIGRCRRCRACACFPHSAV